MNKKITFIILLTVLVLSLAACSSSENLVQDIPVAAEDAASSDFTYTIVETGQGFCYNSDGEKITGAAFDFTNNVDAYGKIDSADYPQGYAGDALYFKAGAYNQCNVNTDEGFWYTACSGTGVWETDYANEDFVQVTFSELILSEAKST